MITAYNPYENRAISKNQQSLVTVRHEFFTNRNIGTSCQIFWSDLIHHEHFERYSSLESF